jgi:hypothetical protein
MAFLKTVTFVNHFGNANDGKIVIRVDDTDPATGPFNVFIDIASPTNPNYYVSNDPVADLVVPDGSFDYFYIDIPQSGGEYVAGNYNITIEIDGYETNTGTFNYQPNVSPGSNASSDVILTTTTKCNKNLLIIEDETVNTGYTLASPARYITLTYPYGSGEDAVVTSEDTLNGNIFEINGDYRVDIELTRQKNVTTSNTIQFYVNEVLSSETTVRVNCLYELLKLKCTFFELVRNYVEQLQYGLECDVDETLEKITKLYAAIFMKQACNNDHATQCKIDSIIKQTYDSCLVSITRCNNRFDTCEDCI